MAKNALQEGDRIPDFSLLNQDAELVAIKDRLGKGPLVIYFYPKDETRICTAEACSFRDSYEEFQDAGADVIGISFDSPEKHKRFAEKYRLPFTLLSDSKKEVLKAFGAPSLFFGFLAGRITYVVDAEGIIRHIYHANRQASQHVDEAINSIRSLQKQEG